MSIELIPIDHTLVDNPERFEGEYKSVRIDVGEELNFDYQIVATDGGKVRIEPLTEEVQG